MNLHKILHILLHSNQFFKIFFLILSFIIYFFFKNPFFYKSKCDLNTFFFNPGQDWSKVRWSRDHFRPPYIVFIFFPRPNFEIAARGRHWRFAGFWAFFIKLALSLYKSVFGGQIRTQRWKSVWKLGLLHLWGAIKWSFI